MNKKISIIMACIIIFTMFAGCSKKEEEVVDKTYTKMDTVIRLKAYGPKAGEAIEAAAKRIDEIEQMASTTIATSDVSKINEAAGREYVKVHPEILKMIKTAVTYSKLSDGAFDITVGPLINLWGIGTANARIPSEEEVKSKLKLVSYNDISINDTEGSIKLLKEGMAIDLGGIAKGFTADELKKVFKNYNVTSALISLGGSSIYTIGVKPDGTQWSIGIQHPRKERNVDTLGIIRLTNQAISTSGDYERYFIKDDKRYHHILNPATGYPAETGVISNTVVIDKDISDSNMLADILTKTAFVLGPEKGLKIIDSIPGVSCMVITTDFKIYKSSAWKYEVSDLSSEFKMMN